MEEQSQDAPPTEGFVYELCKREGQIRLLFLVSTVGVGLMAVWLLLAVGITSLTPGTGSYVVAIGGLVLLSIFMLFSGVMIRVCVKRKERQARAVRELGES